VKIEKSPFKQNKPKVNIKRFLFSLIIFVLTVAALRYLNSIKTEISKIEIVNLPSCKVISAQGKCHSSNSIFSNLYAYVKSKPIWTAGTPFVLYREKPSQNADIEVCIPISGDHKTLDKFEVYNLPGGKMARITLKGPHKYLDSAREKLYSWITKNGYKITGNIREVYSNNSKNNSSANTLTTIYAPIVG